MKEYKVSEGFIKEAYAAACDGWKERIKKEFPEMFEVKKLEVGKWYIGSADFESFINIKSLEWFDYYHRIKYFGVANGENWQDDSSISNLNHEKSLRLATPEEIKAMLLKEAEKRGYKEGVTISWGERVGVIGGDFYWAEGGNCLSIYTKLIKGKGLNPNLPIMHKGKWAEIINENNEILERIESLQKELEELTARVK